MKKAKALMLCLVIAGFGLSLTACGGAPKVDPLKTADKDLDRSADKLDNAPKQEKEK